MNTIILDFLTKHGVCSLTTLLNDGLPHASALHYSHRENPLKLYFSTEKTAKKCESLLKGKSSKASVVIGFSEEEWVTLQMDGEVYLVTNAQELQKIKAIHYAKHPNSKQYENDPVTVFLVFTPTWWRYTDFNTKPPTIITS